MAVNRFDTASRTNINSTPSMRPTLTERIVRAFLIYVYGLQFWLYFLALALYRGSFFSQPTEQEELQINIARDKFWNLSKQPVPGYDHALFTLRSGLKLHYICKPSNGTHSTPNDLIVFIHGFPDTVLSWRHLLEEPELSTDNATLLCVDLPGCGGSDSFEKYDTTVLEALTEFIVAMRERYLQSDKEGVEGNTFIVAHDWGCAIAMRLACEAPDLADRFILSNGPLIEHTKANCARILQSSSKIFRQFRTAPWQNRGCLYKVLHTLKPFLLQALLSGYIFTFNLPNPLIRYLGAGGNMSFVRGVIELPHGQSKEEFNATESMAAYLGPGAAECSSETPKDKYSGKAMTYGSTLLQRANSPGNNFVAKTGYYRDGLALDPWVKSLEAITDLYNIESSMTSPGSASRRRSSSSSVALFADHNKGTLRAPSTIVWGEQDVALSKAICLDGIGDYISKGSEVLLLPQAGHWTAVEKESRAILAKMIKSLIGRTQSQPTYVYDEIKDAPGGARLLVKK